MVRRPLNSTTTSTSVLSFSTKSYLQLPKASKQNREFHHSASVVNGDSRVLTKSFIWADVVFGGESSLARRTSGLAFVCNVKQSYGDTATLYFDGSSEGEDGPGGAGAYLLHPNGDYIWIGSRYFKKTDPIQADYRGLIFGLERAKDAGIRYLLVYGDSDEVNEQVQGKREPKSDATKARNSKVIEHISHFERVECRVTSRGNNSRANKLAREAMKNQCDYEEWYDL